MHHSRNGFLTAKGLAEADQREHSFDLGVDRADLSEYLDSRVSVSGLRRDEIQLDIEDAILDEQYRRFLNEGGV